jgi:hypothetical protein
MTTNPHKRLRCCRRCRGIRGEWRPRDGEQGDAARPHGRDAAAGAHPGENHSAQRHLPGVGGGNRISEERIKYVLDSTRGEAPRPAWGVPQGWGEYLAGEDIPASTYGPSSSGLNCTKIGLECMRDWNHVHACEIRGKGNADHSTWRAELFSWVSEQPITREQAMRCAKREPGRSWEAINSEIRKLGA